MKLYEISTIYANVLEETTSDDPQSVEAALAKVFALEGAFNDKAQNVAFYTRNLEATAKAIKEAETAMCDRRKAIESRVERIKEYLRSNMDRVGVHKIECAEFVIKLKNNPPKVVVEDEAKIPEEYMVYSPAPPPSVDKKKIMEHHKLGVIVDGVRIEQCNRVEIK